MAASGFKQYKTLLGKDLRMEFRTKEMFVSMAVYALLVLTVYGAALSQTGDGFDILQISGGLLWAVLIFTALLGLNRSFANEVQNGSLEGVLLAPVDRGIMFLAKATSNFLFMLAVEVLVVPLFFFFLLSGVRTGDNAFMIIVPVILGTIGISGVGTLLSAMTTGTRSRDVLLAVLFIPTIFPLLYAVVSATSIVMVGMVGGMGVFWSSCGWALAYDLAMTVVCWALYEFAVSV